MEIKDECQSDSSIKLDDDTFDVANFTVMLPLKLYELSIKHRVLSELGELSHFILSVMDRHNLTVENIVEVTGMSNEQIRPIVDRLKALDFLNREEIELSEKGKRLAYILKNIHGKKLSIYIDQNYSSKSHDWFMVLENNSILDEVTDKSIEVPLPRSVRFNPVEDCFNQRQRFHNNYSEVLPKILPEFGRLIDFSSRNRIWYEEWDFIFRTKACDKRMGVPIGLRLKEFNESQGEEESKENKLCFYTQLLRLNVEFSLPKGVDFCDAEDLGSLSFIYSDFDQKIYNYMYFETNPDVSKCLYSEECSDEKEVALLLLEHSLSYIDEDAQLYSRLNSFDRLWQVHEFSYDEIIKNITNSKIIRVER